MTINPLDPNLGIPQPSPKVVNDCTKRTPPEQHDMPEQWDYTHDPGGKKTCRRCGVTWYD